MLSELELNESAERMRENPTEAEFLFAKRLDALDIDYENKVVIGFFIVDFVIEDKMLVVEIDGPVHDKKVNYDRDRTRFLEYVGFTVARIKNDDVKNYDLSIILNWAAHSERSYETAMETARLIRNESWLRQGGILTAEETEKVKQFKKLKKENRRKRKQGLSASRVHVPQKPKLIKKSDRRNYLLSLKPVTKGQKRRKNRRKRDSAL